MLLHAPEWNPEAWIHHWKLLLVNPYITMAPCTSLMYLSSEMKTLHCQLWSTHYTAVQIKINFCNKSSHYENYRRSPLEIEAITCLPQNRHFSWWAKMNGTQRRALVSPWRIHCMIQWWGKRQKQCRTMKKSSNLSHCWVMLVWRHQSVRQLVSSGVARIFWKGGQVWFVLGLHSMEYTK